VILVLSKKHTFFFYVTILTAIYFKTYQYVIRYIYRNDAGLSNNSSQ